MDRYRYFTLNRTSVLVLGVLQVACAGLCVVCGFMDAVFRRDTPLSSTRTPVWGGLIMASPGVLALFASQRKNSVLVSVMVAAAGLSCVAVLFISGYACLTLTYGEEDEDVFRHHDSPQVTFVLHRMVKGANATILLTCTISLTLSSLIAYVGCRSLPCCGCYDARTGLLQQGTRPRCRHISREPPATSSPDLPAKGEFQTQDTTIPSSQDIPWNNLRTATLRKDF
ncbi:uncharacterized protein zgc:113425 isoform X1 [Scophthalmus maximus]|uniref:uncharacterized protein zgc:113425 isoform X1 n=1 Tax=Scophthalmus maximus TaxID=52904 RepID=UPI001FA8BE4E|nr:uncharacterized protein zgc:113425 isoform X1 [Scophthalmus maximus]